jgi:hypothetical protein
MLFLSPSEAEKRDPLRYNLCGKFSPEGQAWPQKKRRRGSKSISFWKKPIGAFSRMKMERRHLLDTYKTFGCDSAEPTFRYSLLDGVRDGFLINPVVVDARTDITTQLLSDKGYVSSLT